MAQPRHFAPNWQLMTSSYTAEEVKSHNSSSDCWVIFKGKVYDVTHFLEDVRIEFIKGNWLLIFLMVFSILEVKKSF